MVCRYLHITSQIFIQISQAVTQHLQQELATTNFFHLRNGHTHNIDDSTFFNVIAN